MKKLLLSLLLLIPFISFGQVLRYDGKVVELGGQIVRYASPEVISGLTAWYDWDASRTFTLSSGGYVSEWRDRSGNDYHLTQASGAAQPQRTGDGVVFDGVDDYLRVEFGVGYSQPWTFFIILSTTKVTIDDLAIIDGIDTTGRALFYTDDNTELSMSNLSYNKTSPFSMGVFTQIYNGGESKMYENSIQKASGNYTLATTGLIGLTIANTFDFDAYTSLGGSIKEIIFYNRILTDTERVYVENYLNNKYNLY